MHIALFVVYGILCGYGILRLPFFRRSGIRPVFLLSFFAIHVAVGCIHNLIAWRYYPAHGDIWDSFRWGLLLRDWLHTDFQHFLGANSKWTYFTHNGVNFIQLLLNFLSFDNLYVNTLLFAFPVFLGNTALYLVFRRHYPGTALTAVVVFLLPSTLFWTACVFREGVLYMLLGFFLYQLDRLRPSSVTMTSLAQRAATNPTPQASSATPPFQQADTSATIWACICFILILYFRFAVGIFLLPALLAFCAVRKPSRKLFFGLAAAALVFLVAMLAFPPVPNWLLHGLSRWQSQFQVLEGHSRLFLPAMDGTWSGLLQTMPYAWLNGLFQPLPGAGGRTIYLAFSIELILIWIVLALAIVHKATGLLPRPATCSPVPRIDCFATACIIFALLGMVAVGAMVPFAGAIVRYRSIYLPFLLAPALHCLRDLPFFHQINFWLRNRLEFFI